MFQKTNADIKNKKDYGIRKVVRAIDLLFVYVLFSGITYFIKVILSSDINTQVSNNFLENLISSPLNQMWFLAALVIIQLVTPVIKDKKSLYVIVVATCCFKVLRDLSILPPITMLNYFLANQIWYVLGMVFCYLKLSISKKATFAFAGINVLLYICCFGLGIKLDVFEFILTLTGIMAVVGFTFNVSKWKEQNNIILDYLSKYMFQIYLLHTICAAGIRIILIRFGVMNIVIHLLAGVVFSFVVPIVCAYIAEKSVVLNFVFYPSKTVKRMKAIKSQRRINAA